MTERNSYVYNILVSLDQFGNSVFGGNPDSTISARTGYFAANRQERFWVIQERVINYAFKPLDGKNHCRDAWHADRNETMYEAGRLAKVGMAVTVLPLCVAIGIGVRIYKAFSE